MIENNFGFVSGDGGISLGLNFSYRAMGLGRHYVFYQARDGRIVEVVRRQESECLTRDRAMKRLHQLNGLKVDLRGEVREETDKTAYFCHFLRVIEVRNVYKYGKRDFNIIIGARRYNHGNTRILRKVQENDRHERP